MADKKLAAIASLLFCVLVAMLLLILYYPDPSDTDDNSEDQWPNEVYAKSLNDFENTSEKLEPASKIASLAKLLEDMGAGFLALLAVICVSLGLFCLICGCCFSK